jgi:hypothetical protein
METKIKVTHTGSHSAKFEHNDVIYSIDWEDDSDTVYLFQKCSPTIKNWKTIVIEKEALPLLIEVLQKAASNK